MLCGSRKENLANRFVFVFYCLLIFSVFVGSGGVVRILSLINVLLVLYMAFRGGFFFCVKLPGFLFVTSTFILLNVLATTDGLVGNEHMKILFSVFFGVGLFGYALSDRVSERWVLNAAMVLLFFYIGFQLVSIFVLEAKNGTFKNPHYIALFSAYASVIAMYYFFSELSGRRFFAIPVMAVLFFLILRSMSRPTWISLFFAALVVVFFLGQRIRWVCVGVSFAVPAVLYVTDLGGFGGRMANLILNITREERVVIWSDVWTMQMSSDWYQWIFGHGLNGFEEAFKQFSRYHLKGIDFTMPHNSVLEVLYATGIVGLAVYAFIYSCIFYWLFRILQKQEDKRLGLVVLAFVIINLVMGLITIKWFTYLNSYPLAFVIGMTCYMRVRNIVSENVVSQGPGPLHSDVIDDPRYAN